MCLIIYNPTGEPMDRSVFDCARAANPDGIGVMSSLGVAKFVGRRSAKKAWAYLRRLAGFGIPHGIHFRLATHGEVTRRNCHPFQAPNSDAIVMHNGILHLTAGSATPERSDTAIFVERYMSGAPGPAQGRYARFYRYIEQRIGIANKLLIYHALTDQFTICNENSGEWVGGQWYSNDYLFLWYSATAIDIEWRTSVPSEGYADWSSPDFVSESERYQADFLGEPGCFDWGAELRRQRQTDSEASFTDTDES